jgi:uncharacterized protein (TIGR02217 family)
MAFHEVQFPSFISYGARGGPGMNTAVVELASKARQAVQRWSPAGARSWNVGFGLRDYDDAAAILNFFIARGGAAHGFRYKDWSDFATTARHTTMGGAAVSHSDEQIGVGDGTTTQFQLVKRYTSGATTVTRNITKPVAGTVKVGVNFADTLGVGWSVNTTTGIVTFSVAPTLGQVVTWGGEYDTPAAFGVETDQQLPMTLEAFDGTSVPDIIVTELVDEAPVDDDFWYGGSKAFGTVSANVTITLADGRTLTFNPDAANRKIFLPNPAAIADGGAHFFLINQSAVHTMLVRTHLDAAVASLGPLVMMTIVLAKDAGGNKTWIGA